MLEVIHLKKRSYRKWESRCLQENRKTFFSYIGFHIEQSNDKIVFNKTNYVNDTKIKTVDPNRAINKSGMLNKKEKIIPRQIVGQLNWAVQGCRPDKTFEIIALWNSTRLMLRIWYMLLKYCQNWKMKMLALYFLRLKKKKEGSLEVCVYQYLVCKFEQRLSNRPIGAHITMACCDLKRLVLSWNVVER